MRKRHKTREENSRFSLFVADLIRIMGDGLATVCVMEVGGSKVIEDGVTVCSRVVMCGNMVKVKGGVAVGGSVAMTGSMVSGSMGMDGSIAAGGSMEVYGIMEMGGGIEVASRIVLLVNKGGMERDKV